MDYNIKYFYFIGYKKMSIVKDIINRYRIINIKFICCVRG